MARVRNSAKEEQAARRDALPKGRTEIYKADYAGYLVCDLLEKHEKELETFKPDFQEVFTWMEEMVNSGLKLVCTYSKDGASVRAELHDMDINSDFAGWRLSAFAGTVWDAYVVLYYKHVTVLKGDWSLAQTERSFRRFG